MDLKALAKQKGLAVQDEEFARFLDGEDELKSCRLEFHYPKNKTLPPGMFRPKYRYRIPAVSGMHSVSSPLFDRSAVNACFTVWSIKYIKLSQSVRVSP